MQIEVRNIRISKGMNKDTCAYKCSVYVDNKLTLYAVNEGQGGDTLIYLSTTNDKIVKRYEKAFEYVSTLPMRHTQYGYIPVTLDVFIDDAVHEFLHKRQCREEERKREKRELEIKYQEERQEQKIFKHLCKNKTLYRLKSLQKIECVIFPMAYCQNVKDLLVLKHGDNLLEIINEKFL